jgi:hypothetical protein
VVSDITREDTIEKAALWKNSIDDNVRQMDGSSVPMVLCLNKSDAISPNQAMSN